MAELVLHTVQSFQEVLRRLQAGSARLPANEFDELQIVHGVRYNPDGLFYANLGVTPLNIMIDWCHTYLVGGLLDHELGLLMQFQQNHNAMK